MQKTHFFKTLLSLIVLCMVVQKSSGTFCSAYCSYYNLGANYVPMCADSTSTNCTKCDESLFTLTSGQCVPHGKFNETLQRTDLTPTLSLVDWYSTNALYHINNVGGLYQTIQFYQDPVTSAGGDDLFYKVFTNLPVHYTVKLRFFVIRSASSTMQFSYYLDNQKFNYNYNQYPSNTTLGDIVTSDKIFHQNSNLTVGFQAKFAAGVTESIGIKELLIFVSKCSLYCQFCSNSTNCVKCGTYGLGDNTYLYNGQCYTECPQQTYAQDLTQTCQPCQAECQNCVGTSTNCTQCKFEGKHQTFLLNNSCFYTCPDGYFKDFDTNQCVCPVDGYFINITTKKCQRCASECNSCSGPSKIQCYNCSVGNFLIAGTTWCSTTCPSGQYANELARKCFHCSSTCSQCVNSSSQCTACFFKTSTRYLYNSQCLTECPTGYEKNFSLRKCVKCPPYYYSLNGECLIECPQYYIVNNQTKSCLHITQTNFSLTAQPTGIEVLMKGKSVKFDVKFSQGLSQSSISWLSSQGYYNTKLHIRQKSFSTSHIKLESLQIFSFTFSLQQQLDESTLITIDFGTRLKTSQNISYSRVTAEFSLSQYPEMLSQYYTKSQGNYLNIVFIPAILIMVVLLAMRSKQTYEMLIQTIRAFQIMGLAVFISYPLQSPIFSLLQSLNYFNLEFFPNVYNWFVPTFRNSLDYHRQFAGFRFFYGDMDFIRMIGSILVFVAVWSIFIVVLKVFFIKNTSILGWLLRLGMDLIEVKILHSFWNSLIFTIINSSQNNIYILWLHLFSYIFMGFTIFRYYKIYQENQTISYTFLWRLIATLLLSVAVYQQMVLLIILSLISVAFGFQQYRSQKPILKLVQSFRFSIAFKIRTFIFSFLPWFSILGISILVFYRDQIPVLACQIIVGILGYLMVALNVIVIILLRYYFQVKQNRNVKVNETGNPGERSKRILNKQIMQENFQHQTTPKHDLQTILSRDEAQTIVTEKQVFIKDQFGADFHHAHKMTIADIGDSHRQNQTIYDHSNYNASTLGLAESAIKNQLSKNQQQSRIKPLKRNSQNKLIQSWQSHQNQDESIFEDGPIERKFGLGHQTQAIRKSKNKLTPLQTVNVKNEDETQFQQIQLTKRSNPDENNPNRPMNSIKLLKDEGLKRFNTVDVTQQLDKKESPGVIYYENQAPRRNLQGTQQLRLRSNVFLRDEQESP